MDEIITTRAQVLAFLNLSGYCFEQSTPLRGIEYGNGYTELSSSDWLDRLLERCGVSSFLRLL